VAEVGLGESFIVETINFRTPVIRRPEDSNPKNYREREETGPIFVRGIETGDVLAIHIEDIQPEGTQVACGGEILKRTPSWSSRTGGYTFPAV